MKKTLKCGVLCGEHHLSHIIFYEDSYPYRDINNLDKYYIMTNNQQVEISGNAKKMLLEMIDSGKLIKDMSHKTKIYYKKP